MIETISFKSVLKSSNICTKIFELWMNKNGYYGHKTKRSEDPGK